MSALSLHVVDGNYFEASVVVEEWRQEAGSGNVLLTKSRRGSPHPIRNLGLSRRIGMQPLSVPQPATMDHTVISCFHRNVQH